MCPRRQSRTRDADREERGAQGGAGVRGGWVRTGQRRFRQVPEAPSQAPGRTRALLAGGSVLSTRCSETYETKTALVSLFGLPLWYFSQSPRVVIQVGRPAARAAGVPAETVQVATVPRGGVPGQGPRQGPLVPFPPRADLRCRQQGLARRALVRREQVGLSQLRAGP